MKIETKVVRDGWGVGIQLFVDGIDCGTIIVASSVLSWQQRDLDDLFDGKIVLTELKTRWGFL